MDYMLKKLIKIKRAHESEIQYLTYLIQTKRDNINMLNEYILTNCKHEWTDDIIDLLESSQKITYCKHCELTK